MHFSKGVSNEEKASQDWQLHPCEEENPGFFKIQIKKRIPRYIPYIANRQKNTEIWIFAHIAQPYAYFLADLWYYISVFSFFYLDCKKSVSNIYIYFTYCPMLSNKTG